MVSPANRQLGASDPAGVWVRCSSLLQSACRAAVAAPCSTLTTIRAGTTRGTARQDCSATSKLTVGVPCMKPLAEEIAAQQRARRTCRDEPIRVRLKQRATIGDNEAANFLVGGIFSSVAVFVLFIVVLLAAPQGLFGAPATRRV